MSQSDHPFEKSIHEKPHIAQVLEESYWIGVASEHGQYGRKIFLTLGFADIDYIHGCIGQSEKSQSSWLIAGLAHGEMLGQHLQLADHFAQNSF